MERGVVSQRPPTEAEESARVGSDWAPRETTLPKGPVPAPPERVVWGCEQIVHVLREVWPYCLDQWGAEECWRIGNAVEEIGAAARELSRLLRRAVRSPEWPGSSSGSPGEGGHG